MELLEAQKKKKIALATLKKKAHAKIKAHVEEEKRKKAEKAALDKIEA